MVPKYIIVIGASAGGFEALKQLTAGLPNDLPASIFVVWHMAPEMRGILPLVLDKFGTMPAYNAVNDEPVESGRIYVAPPDRHMVLEGQRIRITRGPKENRFRPAIDPLFRSAAHTYGSRVIGIILSGALDDGTSGLWTVKRRGGIAIVQDPRDAAVPSMPQSALREVAVDHCVPVAEMPALLERLCAGPEAYHSQDASLAPEEERRVEAEIRTAMDHGNALIDIMEFGELAPYACPECHGVLTALKEGGRIRYRCHTGHAYSSDSLLASLSTSVDESIWNAIRGVEESMMLLNHLGDHCAEQNQPKLAAKYFQKAHEGAARLETLRQVVQSTEALSNERIADESTDEGL